MQFVISPDCNFPCYWQKYIFIYFLILRSHPFRICDMSSVSDRWFLAISVRCCLRRPANDRCGFSGARQRCSATMDRIRAETAKSRRNLRAGPIRARAWGRGRADRALRALCARGRRRELEERAPLFIHSLEDLSDLQLNCDRPRANSPCYFHASSYVRIFYIPLPSTLKITDRKTMYSKHITRRYTINTMNVYKILRIGIKVYTIKMNCRRRILQPKTFKKNWISSSLCFFAENNIAITSCRWMSRNAVWILEQLEIKSLQNNAVNNNG